MISLFVYNMFPILIVWKTFQRSRASNAKVNGSIRSEIEVIRDFMLGLITCKYEEDLIKMKALCAYNICAYNIFAYNICAYNIFSII